jgi:hypothetical protein
VFRAFSDLGRAQHHVALALHATNLLDQMVGTPPEQRQPWSYYRSRIGKKLPQGAQLSKNPWHAMHFTEPQVDGAAVGQPWSQDAARSVRRLPIQASRRQRRVVAHPEHAAS